MSGWKKEEIMNEAKVMTGKGTVSCNTDVCSFEVHVGSGPKVSRDSGVAKFAVYRAARF